MHNTRTKASVPEKSSRSKRLVRSGGAYADVVWVREAGALVEVLPQVTLDVLEHER